MSPVACSVESGSGLAKGLTFFIFFHFGSLAIGFPFAHDTFSQHYIAKTTSNIEVSSERCWNCQLLYCCSVEILLPFDKDYDISDARFSTISWDLSGERI